MKLKQLSSKKCPGLQNISQLSYRPEQRCGEKALGTHYISVPSVPQARPVFVILTPTLGGRYYLIFVDKRAD